MRNLIAFFQRFRIFLVFIILQVFALASYFSILSYPRTKFLNSSSAISASFQSIKNDVSKHFSLENSNSNLQKENIALQNNQLQNYIPLNKKAIKIEDTILQLQYQYVPATIINSTTTHNNNYFTLNIGRGSDIKAGMGVVSSNGIIGKVYDVSEHYAVVKSILTEEINISAEIEGTHDHGLLKWKNPVNGDPKRILLTGISNDVFIKRGAKVITRGSGGIFPKGKIIGKVEQTKTIEGDHSWEIIVRLNNNLTNAQNVYVIKNLMKLEKDKLEETIINELNINP